MSNTNNIDVIDSTDETNNSSNSESRNRNSMLIVSAYVEQLALKELSKMFELTYQDMSANPILTHLSINGKLLKSYFSKDPRSILEKDARLDNTNLQQLVEDMVKNISTKILDGLANKVL